MSDPASKIHIDIHHHAARRFWMQHLDVTEARLRKAVFLVGSRATSVAAYLRPVAR